VRAQRAHLELRALCNTLGTCFVYNAPNNANQYRACGSRMTGTSANHSTAAFLSRERLRPLIGELMRYAAAGLLSYGMGAGLAALFREVLGLRPEIAVGLSLTILLLTNFFINRVFVFRVSSGNAREHFARFAVATAVLRGAEYLIFLCLLHAFHLQYLVTFTLALIISNAAKFVLYRTVVFKRHPSGT
jgi:putative flippase GtrA